VSWQVGRRPAHSLVSAGLLGERSRHRGPVWRCISGRFSACFVAHKCLLLKMNMASRLNAANRRWLALIAEFDRPEGWSDSVTQSCAHWLNWQCGLDLGAAREKLRVAHALERLPLMAAAMARGELSYSKVRALTRVATAAIGEVLLG